jgi:2,5-furandicarboxylate decarboxylase 1
MALQQDNRAGVDSFRVRTFVEQLQSSGELETVDQTVPLTHVAGRLDGNPKAVLFKNAGPEQTELVGNVLGSRKRLALAFGVDDRDAMPEMMRRLQNYIPPREVPHDQAPVQEVVWQGEDADFTRLPVHLQHEYDGAPYISATLDFARDEITGFTNVGIRRIMLRGRQEAGIDMIAPSDLRVIYNRAHQRGEKMPLAFTIGFHPLDAIAALTVTPPMDEFEIMGALRGAPVPVVKCITQDLFVPADAEIVIEGYLDEGGWREPEGPFGEYVGYYGKLKRNPVFHLTAITMRKDALFQTATIGGRFMGQTDTAQLAALKTEGAVWAALQQAVREPVSVYATASSGGMYNVRVSLRQRVPGEARNAIAAVMGSIADVKHVFVMDADIDVFSDEQFDWAFATRFQADRDLVIASGFRVVPLDPSLEGARTGGKAGFDMTMPFGRSGDQDWAVPAPPVFRQSPRRSVREALEEGPCYFKELMEAAGSDDGREVLRELEDVKKAVDVVRLDDGRYTIHRTQVR